MISTLSPAQIPLPALREDISLQSAPPGVDGAPHWQLYDPVRNRFFRIGWLEFELIARWKSGLHISELCQAVKQQTPLAVEHDDVIALLQFLQGNELLRVQGAGPRQFLLNLAQSRRQSVWQWLLHHYLFLRIPLAKPDAWLGALLPYLGFIFRPAFFVWIAVLSIIGLARAIERWDEFTHTFMYFFSWQGAVFYGLALMLTKLVHELGHAFVAKHYGLRVPTMGIAFMLLMPLLYTDTSEGWRLKSRRARLLIDGAGVIAELCLAGLALLLWGLLPEGALKSAAYILAAVTWISTLLVNLNPFMRFDGYYLLMDAVDMPNLQQRSFAVGRWQLRRWLLGAQADYPEPEYRSWRGFMLSYAYTTWLYRLVLFTLIAAAVYYFFFKVLGIILFVVEIGWFILLPIWREMTTWWKTRQTWLGTRNARISMTLLGLILLALLLPLRSEIQGEGYWQAAMHTHVYAPAPAKLLAIQVKEGQVVHQGDVLFRLESPEANWQRQAAESRAAGVQAQIAGSVGHQVLRERSQVLKQELSAAQSERAAQIDEQNRLQITAPHDGVYRDLPEGLYANSWVSPKTLLGNLVTTQGSLAYIFVSEAEVHRIQTGAPAKLMLRRADLAVIPAQVSAIDEIATHALPEALLASTYGGPIAVRDESSHSLIPNEAVYRVTLKTDAPLHTNQLTPITAFVEGERSSVLGSWLTQISVLLIRELGF